MQFLELRCRGKQKKTPLECRSLIGGPALETLESHDFSKGPFVDVRFCHECRKLVKITINSLDLIPEMDQLPKSTRVDFVKFDRIFRFLKVKRHE